jgi:cytochrome b561
MGLARLRSGRRARRSRRFAGAARNQGDTTNVQTNLSSAGDDIYDPVTIFLHWTTMILVLAMYFLVLCPGVVKGSIVLHKSLGLTILAVVLLRIGWRLMLGRKTRTTAAEPLLLRLGAQGAHVAIYALLIITPILGWLYQDAKAVAVYLFGTSLSMPELLYYDRDLAMTLYWWKEVAAYSLLALICVHAVAAILYHAIMKKDGVLRSMLPQRLRATTPA